MSEFQHRQSAHCESGVVSNLLSARGLEISEPMAFGLSSSLIFAYLPMIKMAGQPLIAFRMLPGSIVNGVAKAIGMDWTEQKFSSPEEGMKALDATLDKGIPVGAQTGIYWLPYIPDDMRFHFNAHNIVVMDKSDGTYTISDPVLSEVQNCAEADLRKARFAKGVMAPKGRIYWPGAVPEKIDYETVALKAIRKNAKLIKAPMMPMIGVQGIRFMGKKIRKLEKSKGDGPELRAFLGHIIRMQEEIGTGGAGFRFLYAAFLSEVAGMLQHDGLAQASADLTDAGDEWRRFALFTVKMCKDRRAMDTAELDAILNSIADREADVWKTLRKV